MRKRKQTASLLTLKKLLLRKAVTNPLILTEFLIRMHLRTSVRLIKQFRELFTGEAIIGLNRSVIKAIAIDSAVGDAGTTKQSVRPIF